MGYRGFMKCGAVIVPLMSLIMSVSGTAHAVTVTHNTQSEYSPGTFFQTVLQGTESAPEIRLDSYNSFSWTFQDDDIAGWSYTSGGGTAEENPAGQIHLRGEYTTSEVYAFAVRSDLTIPNQFVAEFEVLFDALQPSGVVDPYVNQPTGGCSRIDIFNGMGGMRVDIFSDRMVSFYREGTAGIDYPTLAYLDHSFNTGQWYTIRFEVDFTAPNMPVEVYLDDVWIGQLKADARNASGASCRLMAYSRTSGSGLSEQHFDYAKLGSLTTNYYSSGTYTSPVMDLHASSFGNLSWSGPASVYPWGPWTKYAGNPVITGSGLVENILCDINDPLQQPIMYDGKYWMVWADCCGGALRISYSTDPNLMVWTYYSGNPILSATPGTETYLFSPNLFKDGDIYYLFYDVHVNAVGAQVLAYATAPAPTGPYTKGQYILDLGAPGEWDDLRVTEPFVFKDGDTYFLYYMGDHGCGGCKEQIGLATTTTALFPLGPEAGGLWTKHGLVLPNGSGPTDWDRGLTADPSVIKVGDTYYMRYTGSYANEHWQLGAAWADNPYGPWNHPAGPEITLGPSGAWDSDQLVRGAIHYHNGKYYSPYTGRLGNYQGGMASAEPYGEDNTLIFETRTSPDGLSWEAWQPILNGAAIVSTPSRYFQYRTTFNILTGNVSPILAQVSFDYSEGGFVSLIPLTQTVYTGAEFTIWISLDAFLANVKGASFKVLYDGDYVEPTSVVEGPEMLIDHFLDYRIYPDGDSILIDIGILDGHFDGPGSLVGINLTGLAATVSTPVTFARSVLRDLDNMDIVHSTQDATVEVLADYVRPTVVVNSPASGGYFNTLPTLNMHFNDDIALNRGYYQIDGCTGTWNELWSHNSAANDTVIDWTVPTVTQASHTIYFRVTDDAGNVNADTCSSSWTFTYDATPPDVPVLLTPADGMYINDNTPYFSWTATVGGGGGGGYTLQYSQDPTFATAMTVSDLTVENYTPPESLADGVWYWHVMAEDAAGNPSAYSGSWSFHLDTQIPSPPTAFTVQPGHNKISLSWVNASTDYDHTVVMRTDWYSDGHGYPEYDDSYAEGPYPVDTATGTKVYSGTVESFFDIYLLTNATRDVYHYAAFTVDAAGNVSVPSNGSRATSYWLGDKTDDGQVYFQDLTYFSNAFWTVSGNPQYDPEFDIGPTADNSAKGIPTTDNAINFEDLIIFAINYATVNPTVKVVPLLVESNNTGPLGLALAKPAGAVPAGQEFTVSVMLENNPGSVKGIHCIIPYDKTSLRFVRIDPSPRLTGAGCSVFFDGRERNNQIDLSMALLGAGMSIGGSGEIATITLRVERPMKGSLEFGLIDIRDGDNVVLLAEQKGFDYSDLVIPKEYGLMQNRPNPFNPTTEIMYQIPQAGQVILKIFNIQGQVVRTLVDGYTEAGFHTIEWNSCDDSGGRVASGMYLYRITAGPYTETKKMVLLK